MRQLETNSQRLQRLINSSRLAKIAEQVLTGARMPVVAGASEGLAERQVALLLEPGHDQARLLGTRRRIVCLIAEESLITPSTFSDLAALISEFIPQVTSEVALVISADQDIRRKCEE